MSQIKIRVVEVSLVGSALPAGVALGPAGRLVALAAEAQAWDTLRELGISEAL